MKTHGDFGWRDLLIEDVKRAREFYARTFGWNAVDVPIGEATYTVFKAGDRPVAGLKDAATAAPGSPSGWMDYVTVDDVEVCVARAEGAGGKVIVAPVDVPGVGRMAIIEDSAGHAVGVITYADPDGLRA